MAPGGVIDEGRAANSVALSVGLASRLAGTLLAIGMFLCAFATWTAVPAAIIFALPRVTHRELGMPVLLVAVFVGMVAMTEVVWLLNVLYCRVLAVPPPPPAPPAWRRSCCEPAPASRTESVMATAVAMSAVASLVALGVWFLFFAHCGQGFCAG